MLPHNPPARIAPELVVHAVHRPPAPVLRYIDQVVDESSDVAFRYSQGVLTQFDIDVVLVADENLDQLLGTADATPPQRLASTVAFTRNLRRNGIALVRMISGFALPAPTDSASQTAARMLDGATTTFVIFDDVTTTPDASRTVLIPHAQYAQRFEGYPTSPQVSGRVLCLSPRFLPAGAKGLVAAMSVSNTGGATLRLAGRPTRTLTETIRTARIRHEATVSFRLEQLSDGAQVQEIDAAELVVLPRVASMEDLQTAFLAISRRRTVLTSESARMSQLAETLGHDRLIVAAGSVTAEAIDESLEIVRRGRHAVAPKLRDREMSATSSAYSRVFRDSANTARSKGPKKTSLL